MTQKQTQRALATPIRAKLSGLRRRIRAYVILEGCILALIWLALTFWCGLAIDYLPVFVGASELPREARIALLVVIAAVLAFILFKWVLARTITRMSDRSMAVLLERRFGEFNDSLVTTVEMSESPDHASEFSGDMLGTTDEEALAQIKDVSLGSVFRLAPLGWKLALAILLIGPIVIFGINNTEVLATWAKRGYLLSDEKWERYARISVHGVEVLPNLSLEGDLAAPKFIPFNADQRVKVARGASVRLITKASPEARKLPEFCTVFYKTADQDRGTVKMMDYREARDGFREFRFDGKPFRGILSALTFDVRGYDHRVRGYHVDVVDSPVVESWSVDCEFPAYLEKLPYQDVALQPKGVEFARGSKIRLRATTNKQIVEARITKPLDEESEELVLDVGGRNEFFYEIDTLLDDVTLEITLIDSDGLLSERPQRVNIGAVVDTAPRVDAFLKGIGSAVTPDVVIPFQGTITDDNGVARSWVNVYKNDAEPKEFEFDMGQRNEVETNIDFRDERSIEGGIELKEKDKLTVMVSAQDNFKLAEEGPNVTSGDRYELNVVTPAELLRLLELEELGLRRRFELIVDEAREMKDSLVRVQDDLDALGSDDTTEEESAVDPEDDEETVDPEQAAAQAKRLRLLRVQRGLLQSQKSASETLGVSVAFEDIRQEIVNNRVTDAEDRKERLKTMISDPLNKIGQEMFPQLDRYLAELEEVINNPEKGPSAARIVVAQADDVVVEMEVVLENMLKLEDYNELLKLVRGLLKDQEDLIDETKKERKNQLLGDLLKPKK